jgi:Uroporphyrinogen decarboxylase (URO-D)
MDEQEILKTIYLSAQFAAGVEAVQVFESFAGAIPQAFLGDWSLGPTRRIVEGLRAKVPDARIIVFAKGSGLAPGVISAATGADAVGLDWTVDPSAVSLTSSTRRTGTPHQGYGKIVRIQRHDAPEWFGDGWLVSFELPTRNSDQMPVTRVAFFQNDNGTPELARDIVVKDGRGKYPDVSWKPL